MDNFKQNILINMWIDIVKSIVIIAIAIYNFGGDYIVWIVRG